MQTFIAFMAILGQLMIVSSTTVFFLVKGLRQKIRNFSNRYAYIIVFWVSLLATLGSLYFSDVVGWEPCTLCWYQRIAMYPIVVISAIGIWKQDLSAKTYMLILSIMGFIIALYQIYIQVSASMGSSLTGFCSTIGATDCSSVYMIEFGYVTFPVVSATVFLAIISILSFKRE
ncbi:MAG: disulfide bond formation protein B [Candidatus Pacebacteria bacterium]|nr:disulfide bond formation protein B [Candidatus Paceibacterota bacterium]